MIRNKHNGRIYYSWDEALDSVIEGEFVDDDVFGRRRIEVEKGFGGVTIRVRTILGERRERFFNEEEAKEFLRREAYYG